MIKIIIYLKNSNFITNESQGKTLQSYRFLLSFKVFWNYANIIDNVLIAYDY